MEKENIFEFLTLRDALDIFVVVTATTRSSFIFFVPIRRKAGYVLPVL